MAPDKIVTIAGYEISGGMIYVGLNLPANSTLAQDHPSLINPALRIEQNRPDHEGMDMSYWPAYVKISPACRAAYLEWLAGGRSAPNTCIGYVFLFFYGLEYRVLKDYPTLKPDQVEELAQITNEVERLLDIYGANNSFHSYGSDFLDICRILQNSSACAEIEPPLTRRSWDMPLCLKTALGNMVAEGQPIPADWMLSWYFHSEQAGLRTPATRCAEEFRKLLKLRYQQCYGEGMVIKRPKRRLTIEYHPASASLSTVDLAELGVEVRDLPDVTTLRAPLNKLQNLIDECTDALDPYSRWLGRNGENPDPKVALALLPPELVGDLNNDHLNQLKQWLAQTIGKQEIVVIPGEDLLIRWSSTPAETLTKKESTTLSQGLEKLGYGLEPDIRFGGKPFRGDRQIALFKLSKETISVPSQEYTAAALLLHLAATVASSDASVDAAEQNYLEQHLESSLQLAEPERIRLRAHLAWLLQEKLSLRGLKTKLSKMPSDERAGIADFLISVAGADGQISPKEISTLTKIYPLLGFEADEVYSRIHSVSTLPQVQSASAPVTVRPAAPSSTGFAIPASLLPETEDAQTTKISENNNKFELNLGAIQYKQAESARVANLLGNLFEEDESEIFTAHPPTAEDEVFIAGLDALHSQFLLAIARQTSWNRDALEVQADDLGLMLDGALEVINDAAFDTCDAPLTDGDDTIELDTDVLAELLP
ncbi:TerB N-terminal domain-containing protein [filamentous cyanobacterium LEGE 07170]|nr:TerB N-terminal domain-containing protein [filamentous cyanobacterium LEGE 07170]